METPIPTATQRLSGGLNCRAHKRDTSRWLICYVTPVRHEGNMSESSEIRPTASLNTNRIEAFSDGVFAVAINLLVLNLQVPQLAASVVSRELVSKLFVLGRKLLNDVRCFVIVV